MKLSTEGNSVPDDAPEYPKANNQFSPFEKLLPIIIAVVLSYVVIRK